MLGQRLNNFEIVRSLGEGGMGAVYEAEHLLIRRKVAVKVLKPELALDAELVQRFFNEARATSAIRHPNIVEVIDVGRFADGVPYLVMELLEGESLAERLGRLHTLEIADAIEVVRQATSALIAAHGAGIVHRDLKPENLFLVPDQRFIDRELVKVLDFGIAKLRADITTAPVHTMAGALFGTPPYMSPEQCRGVPDELDERTDIYALGVILYEALCGQPPFVSEGVGELMMMHMTTEPKPPSIYRPELPADVERVILRALAKRREDRFADMRELQSALSATVGRAATLPQIELARAHESAAHGGEVSREVPISKATAPDAPGTNGSTKRAPISASPAKVGRILIAATLGALGLIVATTSLHGSLRRESPLETATSLAAARTFTPPTAAKADVTAASGGASTPLAAPLPQPTEASSSQPSPANRAPHSSAPTFAPAAHAGTHHADHLATKSIPASNNHEVNSPPSPPSAAVPIATTNAVEPSAVEKSEPGYLSLDSAPWSEVFLHGTLLGTTPIMHVPLPPGRHLLTLKNSELGTSTSYMVEIKSGQTVSRLVGWEK